MIWLLLTAWIALALATLLWTDADRARALHFIGYRVLPEPRVIMDRAGGSPYLARWYLIGAKPSVDEHGNPIGKVKKSPYQVLLHRFFRGDHDGELHSHPWRWAVAIVLAGGYVEERRVGDRVVTRRCGPGTINVIRAEDFHRVDLIGEESWSLFITGPKVADWFFWCRERFERAQWRAFLAWKQEGAAEPTWTTDAREPTTMLVKAWTSGYEYGRVIESKLGAGLDAAKLQKSNERLERALLASEAERDALRSILATERGTGAADV